MRFIPEPKNIDIKEGKFYINSDTVIALTSNCSNHFTYAKMLKTYVKEFVGIDLHIEGNTDYANSIILKIDNSLNDNAYRISINEDKILVEAFNDERLLNAIMTLRQCLIQFAAAIPCMEIYDFPDLEHRGYYLDCSRGRVPNLDTLKKIADTLAYYKINEWQLYIEHTFLFKKISEAWRDDTPLSPEEIIELDEYCHLRNIELVPSLSSFGHMYEILSTKTYCELCELDDSEKIPFTYTYAGDHHTLNVSNENSLKFIKSLISEYMQLFKSNKFNICCDETFDLGKCRSKKLAEERGEHTIYMDHLVDLLNFVLEKGKTPMFWGDIMWRHPEAYVQIPKGVICLNWGYLPNQRENEVRDLAQMGATQYVCPGVCTWNRWFPLFKNSFLNNSAMCKHGKKYNAIGHLNTDWGDYAHICHTFFSVPGILYGSNFSWNTKDQDFDELNRAISLLEYGDISEKFMENLIAISENEAFEWFNAVRFIEAKEEEKKFEILKNVNFKDIKNYNDNIDKAVISISENLKYMQSDKREIFEAISIVSHGVKIFNNIALWIYDKNNAYDKEISFSLAIELECWFHKYKTLWRKVAKESRIYRMQQIIDSYANMLRER